MHAAIIRIHPQLRILHTVECVLLLLLLLLFLVLFSLSSDFLPQQRLSLNSVK